MTNYVFITDTHFTAQSNVRTGDVVADLKAKLEFVVDYSNSHDATLLIGGDVFDKPTVPDFVKSELAPVLLSAKHVPYVIYGNHDILYNTDDKNYKTSLNLWITHGVVRVLDTIDFSDHRLTSSMPLKTCGMPTVAMYHGFLNRDDGRYSVGLQDLLTDDPTILLLGHDHTAYEPVEYDTITIVRPGSFLRGIRDDNQFRIPELVHIQVDAHTLTYETVPIKCREAALIFQTKQVSLPKSGTDPDSYSAIIDQIRNSADTDELTFQEALVQVSDPQTVRFVMDSLSECRTNQEDK